jgi:hypothetical protein
MKYGKVSEVIKGEESLAGIPIEMARVIRHDDSLTPEQKQSALGLVREWVVYAKEHDVQTEDPFLLRAHLEDFAIQAVQESSPEQAPTIQTYPLEGLRLPDGTSPESIISTVTDPQSIHDNRVLIYGGAARAIAKLFVITQQGADRELLTPELPLSDIDMMISGSEHAAEIAEHYGSDLAGTKIIQDPIDHIKKYITSVDVTMNQCVVYNGQLYVTEEALSDISSGTVSAIGSVKPLFGSDSYKLPNGSVYLERSGFYRTLAMLLRGRGERILVSKENLAAERENIGRYWLVLLFVKLLKISDANRRDEAILQWHQVARDIGSTETETPSDFLDELMEKFPEFSYLQKGQTFDTETQTRWLIGKLADQGRLKVIGIHHTVPETYTPTEITLRPYEGNPNLQIFWLRINQLQQK